MSIIKFRGEYNWLSNFYDCKINYKGKEYKTTEHAYQAEKCLKEEDSEIIRQAEKPGDTKRLIKTMEAKPNWEEIKVGVMEDILRLKFTQKYFKDKLLATKDEEIIEGNTWYDRFWGQCPIGVGENVLGKLIMKIRKNLVEKVDIFKNEGNLCK